MRRFFWLKKKNILVLGVSELLWKEVKLNFWIFCSYGHPQQKIFSSVHFLDFCPCAEKSTLTYEGNVEFYLQITISKVFCVGPWTTRCNAWRRRPRTPRTRGKASSSLRIRLLFLSLIISVSLSFWLSVPLIISVSLFLSLSLSLAFFLPLFLSFWFIIIISRQNTF